LWDAGNAFCSHSLFCFLLVELKPRSASAY
jgi:hypothetical protein